MHLILDNYATHKDPKVKAWLAKHPRFHLHFTPTSASWPVTTEISRSGSPMEIIVVRDKTPF